MQAITINGCTFTPTAEEAWALLRARLVRDSPVLPAAAEPRIVPAIGASWEGGIYAGVSISDDGVAYRLVLADTQRNLKFNWQQAMEWAKGLRDHGFDDWSLMNRHDGIVLFKHLKDRFDSTYHWTCEEVAQVPGFAWCQNFGDGSQGWAGRNDTLRARAVRRLPI